MSREIKFRAWNGDMMSKPFAPWELLDDKCGGKMDAEGVSVYWIGNTAPWMQFTGLKDKNGVEIYEGDILFFDLQDYNGTDHFWKSTVVGGPSFGCELDYGGGQLGWVTLQEIFEVDEEWEVVGNLYENPNLLTKEAGA